MLRAELRGPLLAWATATAAVALAGPLGVSRALGGAAWVLGPALWASVPAFLWLAGRARGDWGVHGPARPTRALVETAVALLAVALIGAWWGRHSPVQVRGASAILLHLLWIAPAEELFFRGYLQAGLRTAWGGSWAAAATAALFGVSHAIVHRDPGQLVTAVPGLLFAAARERHGTLLTPILLHGAANVAVIAFLP
ncbi:MAG: CPBP family intramembrane metalloprotease [Planctomycetales bacterium]|nr:CPBP family intramembrane metalloprotease [Planctomycetales bacterium]